MLLLVALNGAGRKCREIITVLTKACWLACARRHNLGLLLSALTVSAPRCVDTAIFIN